MAKSREYILIFQYSVIGSYLDVIAVLDPQKFQFGISHAGYTIIIDMFIGHIFIETTNSLPLAL